MGLDINLFRPEKGTNLKYSPNFLGGNPEVIKESIKKRHQDPKIVDDVLALDEEWRKSKTDSYYDFINKSLERYNCDQLRKERNAILKAIGEKKKKNKDDPCEVFIITSTIKFVRKKQLLLKLLMKKLLLLNKKNNQFWMNLKNL